MSSNPIKLHREIETYISGFSALERNISPVRRAALQPLVEYMGKQIKKEATVQLNFICTHNSRRSHLTQVWAQAMATHFGLPGVYCYSGGTKATALFPLTAQVLRDSGFSATAISPGKNPVYAIRYATALPPLIGFSKAYDHPFNPKRDFAAVITCAKADTDCPIVHGAEARISLPYEDPKLYDSTPKAAEKYAERSRQIAAEMWYVGEQLT